MRNSIGLRSPSSGVPGYPCPGLIEAGRSARSSSAPSPRVPGYPCPGLIEAGLEGRGMRIRVEVFRGILAPASLKRHAPRSIYRAEKSVPGYPCPGLIEALRLRARPARLAGVPGYPCPGLIEAQRGERARAHGCVCSGVSLPRPH